MWFPRQPAGVSQHLPAAVAGTTELHVPSFAPGMGHKKAMLVQGRGVCIRSELP